MKQCPKCKHEYDDDSLRFCLEDGTPLARSDVSPKSEEATAVLRANEPQLTTIAQPARPDVPLPATVRAHKTTNENLPATSRSAGTVRIVIAVLFVISLVLTMIGWVGWGYITFRRIPLVLLFLGVMVLAFVRAPRHPKVSLLTGLALGFDLIESAIYIFINRSLQPLQATLKTSDAQMQTVFTTLTVLDDFALAAVFILLTAAVLTGRKAISQTA
jgi:cell division protein FtsX